MAWKMYYCNKCGIWQSAKQGSVCSRCGSEMVMTDYVDVNFPPSEEFVKKNDLKFNSDLGTWESAINVQQNTAEVQGGNPAVNSKEIKRTVYRNINEDPLYREVSRMSKDIRFIANVLKAYIIINVIAAVLGLFIWIIMIS